MKTAALFQKLKSLLKRASSLLMLFQRTPAAQVLLPAEFNLASSSAMMDASRLLITTVAGLGAYDSVAGATTLAQLSPTPNSTIVPVRAGVEFTGAFQVTGSPAPPQYWEVIGTLPNGLSLDSSPGSVALLTGTTLEMGDKNVIIKAYQYAGAGAGGGSIEKSFTIRVTAPPEAFIASHPASTEINLGQTATLMVAATGTAPINYQWYQGSSGDTSTPVGENDPSFTTPMLTGTTSYWVKVSNSVTPSGVSSNTATVTVRTPAAITQQPESISIFSGLNTTLTVMATGSSPLTYQWYQGESGDTSTPVGSNQDSFTTPRLSETTSYWVRVSNIVLPEGVDSNTAVVTVEPTEIPSILTPSPLPTARTGLSYSTTFEAFGGTTPYSWSVSSGSLPQGLTLSPDGVLSGTPSGFGSFTFTLEVADQELDTDSREFSLVVSNLAISTSSLPTAVKGTPFSFSLAASGSNPVQSWAVHAGVLPAGISLNSSTGVLSGTPTTPGSSSLTFRVTDSSGFSVTRALLLTVSAKFIKPVLDPVTFPTITVGETFLHRLSAQNYPKTFSVTGLPKGLKLNAASGEITGVPDVSGLFILQIRASNSAGASLILKAPLTIKSLPKNLVGSFGGTLQRLPAVNQNLGGMFSLSVTSNGFYSLKLTSALASVTKSNAASSFSSTGRLAPSPPHISIPLAGQPLSLSINPASGAVSGFLGAASLSGWRAAWNAATNPAENLVGYYSFAIDLSDPADDGMAGIPQGSGFATFSVSNSGAISIVGKSADGEPLTSSPLLGSSGEFWLYSPLYKSLGSLQGSLTLTEDPAGLFSANSIAGLLSWSKPNTTSRAYPAFGPINLKAEGAYLAPASKGNPALGLPDTGTVGLRFTDGGLADSDTDPDVDFTFTDEDKVLLSKDPLVNKGQAALSLNPASGAISGTFTLVETTPAPFTRAKVPFQAQVVRLADGQVRAAGFFLLPQVPAGAQKPADTPILSGGVQLIQPVP
ncbi:MAG: hypothetical protein CJBNEKGG_04218 [Prosthecobacter sp.]|nr:hypothetical protein [Prosthecobacter sp.]